MNFRTLFITLAFTTLPALSVHAQGGPDIEVRQAIFFTGTGTTSLDAAEASKSYAPKNQTLKIKASAGTGCNFSSCLFNLGVLTWRDGKKGILSTYGQFTQADGSIYGNTIYFADGKQFVTLIVPVRLKTGKNKVTFTIDPQNKVTETNKTNNSVTAYLDVEWDRPVIGKPTTPKPVANGGSMAVATVSTPPQLPNLRIFSYAFTTNKVIAVTVANDCDVEAWPTTLRLDIYNSPEQKSGVYKSMTMDVPAIGPKGQTVVSFDTPVTGDVATIGVGHYLLFTVNPDNDLKEVTTADNTLSISGNHSTYAFPLGCKVKK